MPISQKCFAYKILKKQIGQQCKIYRDLRETGNLGSLSGMYVPNEEGRNIPSDSTSAFLRGGIINTMACFEAYLHNLLDEASDIIRLQRNPHCSGTCEQCMQLKYEHVVLRPEHDDHQAQHNNDPQQVEDDSQAGQHNNDPQQVDGSQANQHNNNPQQVEDDSQAGQHNNDPQQVDGSPQANQHNNNPQQVEDDPQPARRFGMYEEQDRILKTRARVSINWQNINKVYSFKFGRGKDSFTKELFSVGNIATLSSQQIQDQKELELIHLEDRFRQHANGRGKLSPAQKDKLRQQKENLIREQEQWQNDDRQDDDMMQDAESKPITYYYPINTSKISRMNFSSEDLLHMMLRFCYGIRCVMGHGNATQTLQEKALKNFPSCLEHCECHIENIECTHVPQDATDTIKKLKKIETLNRHFIACINEQGKKRVMKTSRHFPRPKPLQKLENKQKNNAMTILQDLFPALYHDNFIESQQEVLDENYALFHMCRIHSYLKENERMMYITYRLLVRINQFILVLAHRMRIAVGRILIYKYNLPDRTWGVPRSKQGQIRKIKKFENGHQQMVLNLLRPQSCTNMGITNRPALFLPHQANHCATDTYNSPITTMAGKANGTVVVIIVLGCISMILNFFILIKVYYS